MQNDEYDASNRDQIQSPNDVIVRSGESGNERQLGFSTFVQSKPNIILTVDGGKIPVGENFANQENVPQRVTDCILPD
jgi:hypothetical protein